MVNVNASLSSVGGVSPEASVSLVAPTMPRGAGSVEVATLQKYASSAVAAGGGSVSTAIKSPLYVSSVGAGGVSVRLRNSNDPGASGAAAWLGEYGAITEIPYITSRQVTVERPVNIKTTIGGRKVASAGRFARRRWNVGVQSMRPADLGALAEKLQFGAGPFLWIDPHMTVTNMLTPAQANLEPASAVVVEGEYGGRLDTDDGPAWSSVSFAAGSTNARTVVRPVPVREGRAITASAYVKSPNGFKMMITFERPDGSEISGARRIQTFPGSTRATRYSMTEIPPLGAERMALTVMGLGSGYGLVYVCRPCVTWTPHLLDWSAGQGVEAVVCAGFVADTVATFRGPSQPRTATLQFTVEEIG